jgi:hypothetical protein
MKRLLGLLISGALIAGSGGAALAQQTNPKDTTGGAKQGTTQGTTQGTRDNTGATKSTTKKTKKTTKKSVNKGTTDTGKGTGTTGQNPSTREKPADHPTKQ